MDMSIKTDLYMIKSLINIIKDIALKHKGVKTFRYQSDFSNNAQHNYGTYQVYVDNVNHHQLNITTNIFTSEFQIYILSQPTNETSGQTVEDIQTVAFTIAVDILGYIDTKPEFQGILNVHDYSILTLADYTAQRSAGVKLSLVLEVPSPLNLCNLDDNFNEKPWEDEEDNDIDVDPIDLPITIRC